MAYSPPDAGPFRGVIGVTVACVQQPPPATTLSTLSCGCDDESDDDADDRDGPSLTLRAASLQVLRGLLFPDDAPDRW